MITHDPTVSMEEYLAAKGHKSYLAVVVSGSFCRRLFPCRSITLFHSAFSLHGLSQTSDCVVDKQSTMYNEWRVIIQGTNEGTASAYKKQFRSGISGDTEWWACVRSSSHGDFRRSKDSSILSSIGRLQSSLYSCIAKMANTAPGFKIEEQLARKRSERLAYLVTVVISSFRIISMAVMAIYYRFSWKIDSEEFPMSEMFRTFAHVVWSCYGHGVLGKMSSQRSLVRLLMPHAWVPS